MLAPERDSPAFELIRQRCQQRLQVPEHLRQKFEQRDPNIPLPGDRRQFPRKSALRLAILEYYDSLPALPRPAEFHLIQFVDISRAGVAFLHCEQLYPGERKKLHLEAGKAIGVEVMNCRKLADSCYQIGARFVATKE